MTRYELCLMCGVDSENLEKYLCANDLICKDSPILHLIYWWNIPYEQKLSEDFIREFQNKVDWWNVYHHQYLSKEFIEEFKSLGYIKK